LLHLVNKLVVTGRIARWLLLHQEFDFKVVYKLGKVHFLFNHLAWVIHGESLQGVDDQLLDANLFIISID
jgi:hypothetical protein